MGTFGTIFDIGPLRAPILAGLLIAEFNYFYSFWMMAAVS
jgi:hypothetical protein